MADRPRTLQDAELESFLNVSRAVVEQSIVRTPKGLALAAAPPTGGRPMVDTRSTAVGIVTLGELGEFRLARSLADFLLTAQSPSGAWVQAYDAEGNEAGQVGGEDVTALVLWALMSYVRASGDEAFSDKARDHVDEAARYTRARTLNPYLYLIETTDSIHGPAVSPGYELWNNCAHAAAFALCHRVYGGERFRRLALLIRRAIGLLMSFEGRFLRRLDPSGYPDPRSDVTLISPHYFTLWPPTERMVMNSAELIERTLWNVELGGYIRYLPYSARERTEMFGPSPRFTAWMARFHYELGNRDRAEAVMRWLFDNTVDGRLADVLVPSVAARRYLPEQRRLLTDRDSQRTLSEDERSRLLAELDEIEDQSGNRDVVPRGTPLIWAHLETLRALRQGGYIEEDWRLDPAAAATDRPPDHNP